jgi:hypothetical protein
MSALGLLCNTVLVLGTCAPCLSFCEAHFGLIVHHACLYGHGHCARHPVLHVSLHLHRASLLIYPWSVLVYLCASKLVDLCCIGARLSVLRVSLPVPVLVYFVFYSILSVLWVTLSSALY